MRKILQPITDIFIIKEKEEEPTWLDTFDDYILECYNAMPNLIGQRELVLADSGFTIRLRASWRNLMTHVEYDDPYTVYYADNFWIVAQLKRWLGSTEYVITDGGITVTAPGNPYTDPDTNITTSINSDIIELTATSTGVGHAEPSGVTEATWVLSGSDTVFQGNRTKDAVVWIYSCELIDMQSGEINSMDYRDYADRISDELYLPGQRGSRLISSKYKEAPWERYPNL